MVLSLSRALCGWYTVLVAQTVVWGPLQGMSLLGARGGVVLATAGSPSALGFRRLERSVAMAGSLEEMESPTPWGMGLGMPGEIFPKAEEAGWGHRDSPGIRMV